MDLHLQWICSENALNDLQQFNFNYIKNKERKCWDIFGSSCQQHLEKGHTCDFTAGLQLQSN